MANINCHGVERVAIQYYGKSFNIEIEGQDGRTVVGCFGVSLDALEAAIAKERLFRERWPCGGVSPETGRDAA